MHIKIKSKNVHCLSLLLTDISHKYRFFIARGERGQLLHIAVHHKKQGCLRSGSHART